MTLISDEMFPSSDSLVREIKRKKVSWMEPSTNSYRHARVRARLSYHRPASTQERILNDFALRESIENRTLHCVHELTFPGCSDSDFQKLFENAMKKEGLTYFESALVQCTFAGTRHMILEFMNADMATRALNLNQYPSLYPGVHNNRMFLSRPSNYAGSVLSPSITWQDFRGEKQSIQIVNTKNEHVRRVVRVEYLRHGMSKVELHQEIYHQLMKNRFSNALGGNPIRSLKVKDGAGIVTFRTEEEATAMLELKKVEIQGDTLRFVRVTLILIPSRSTKKESFQVHHDHRTAASQSILMRREEPDEVKMLKESLQQLRQELQKSMKSRTILQDDLDKAKHDLAESQKQLESVRQEKFSLVNKRGSETTYTLQRYPQKESRKQKISVRTLEQQRSLLTLRARALFSEHQEQTLEI